MSPSAIDAILPAIAADLRLLARLHDREPDSELLNRLRQTPFQSRLALILRGERSIASLAAFDAALSDGPESIERPYLDRLAVEYTDIYLNYARRVSPLESVWLTDDNLARQEPMFAVRGWYEHYGLAAENWRLCPDDHLVLQLEFLATLCESANLVAIVDAGRFLDAHLLRWLPQFATAVAERSNEPYWSGLAITTDAYVDELRDLLVEITNEPRKAALADEAAPKFPDPQDEEAAAYAPGAEPSW
ncbi:MAG: hypothetical protein GY798_31105 [Hyphomicrobiales bacterium]|nr:hypothetical protein [Hyphomicrobiales bacterium]